MPSLKRKSIEDLKNIQFIKVRIRFATFVSTFNASINHYYQKSLTVYHKDNIFPYNIEFF